MNASDKMIQYSLKTSFLYIEKNPEENLSKLMDWVDRIASDGPDSFLTTII